MKIMIMLPDYSIADPDFNFHQFRSNFVAKWEYRLGSFIYFVWSSERTGRTGSSDISLVIHTRNYEIFILIIFFLLS